MRAAGLLLLFVLVVSVAGYVAVEQGEQQPKERVAGNALEKFNLIRVATPASGDVIQSPVTVQGKARGSWFFEADFPVKVVDGQGNVLGQGPAQALGEWMIEDFVPFQATVNFKKPSGNEGILILERSNPSGLPEQADELRVPIRFSQ